MVDGPPAWAILALWILAVLIVNWMVGFAVLIVLGWMGRERRR
jgi:hypothetical protein